MKKLTVEIADNSILHAQGLMGRKELQKEHGMLFIFPFMREASFWGKDTYIPLDIAFINKNKEIIDIQEIVPMSTKPVRSNGICSFAIETHMGFFKDNEIDIGHTIKIEGDQVLFDD